MKVNIYEYSHPKDYLVAVYLALKQKNLGFSMRAFAKSMGLSTHSGLSRIIKGERAVSTDYISKIATYLHLNSDEHNYLILMNKLDGLKTDAEKKTCLGAMKLLAKKNCSTYLIVDDFEIQKNPLAYFILELIDLAPLKYDARLIQKRLCYHFELEEIDSIIKLLLHRDFLYLCKDDYLVGGSEKFLYSQIDRKNLALRSYHRALCQIAAVSVEEQSIEEKEFNGISLNIDSTKMPEVKRFLREVQQEFIARFNEPSAITAKTYQLNTQLFKIAH